MPCWSPITLKNQSSSAVMTGKHMSVPCGRCLGCLQRKRADWTIRLSYEEKVSKHPVFLTMTYDEDHIPETPSLNFTLSKKDSVAFFKKNWHDTKIPIIRLNKKGELVKGWFSPLKYFIVGEYGYHTKRPHMHAAIFNVPWEILYKNWEKGNLLFGSLNQRSIHYITKYMINEEDLNRDWQDLQPPFRLMSKGLGKGLADELRTVCRHNNTNIVRVADDHKIILPRYIADKIFSRGEKFDIAERAIEEAGKKKEKSFFEILENQAYQIQLAKKTNKSLKC